MFSPSHLHLPPLGASKGILELEEEKIIPTEEPKQIKSEYGEERCTEKSEDHQAQHMDYILVNHEEKSPPKLEACEARESTPELEEFHVGPGQMRLPGTQLASFSDPCQPASLNERKDHSAGRISSKGHQPSSLETLGQDQSWMVLGHGEGDSPSSEAREKGPGWSGKAVEPVSDDDLDKCPQMQVLGETKPLESLALEETSSLGRQSRKSQIQSRAGPDAVMLQAVTHDNEWEMLSPQPSQKNMIPGTETEEETEFLESRTRKPTPNG